MNCPKCRRKMDYERELSTPNVSSATAQKLVYYCAWCETLWIFREITLNLKMGGRLVMSIKDIKRAGFLSGKDLNRST